MEYDLNIGETDPRSAGMDSEHLALAAGILNEAVETEVCPGGVLWVARRGRSALLHAAGHTDYSRSTPIDEHTLFDLASVTKPVAMASSMLVIIQEGRVHLGQNVVDFFPGKPLPHLRNVTLRHLLTHTSGLPPWRDCYSRGQTREQMIDDLFAIPLDHEPGTHYAYSCMGYIMLSLVLEAVTGKRVDEFAKERVFEPLGMHDTVYNPKPLEKYAIAATDHCPMRKCRLVGEVHDGNAYALEGVSGNAGLFAPMHDLARFCHAVTFGPFAGDELPFSPPALRLIFANAIDERIGGQTIGWFISPNDMLPAGDLVSKSAIGHSGFTGTAIIIDPGNELCAVLLTNRVCRDDDGTAFRHARRRIFNAVLGSIVW